MIRLLRSGVLFALIIPFALAAEPPTVKLRSLELKSVSVAAQDSSGKAISVDILYSDLLRQVILTAPQTGNSADDVVRSIEVWEPIKKAIDSKSPNVLLSDSDYQFILGRINAFRWGGLPEVQTTIAAFIKYVRALKEQDFAATPKT